MDSRPLIDPSRIISHGPKRLKPMQGQRFDPETRTWKVKNPKKAPDPVDRRKVQERIAVESVKPLPPETKPMDLSNYRPLPGKVLLRVGVVVESEGGVLIPDVAKWTDQTYTVLAVGGDAPFKPGNQVILDRKCHKRPIDELGTMIIVKTRHVSAVLGEP